MTTTTYYDLNIVEGTDIVNPLTVDNPNYEAIDEVMHNNAVAGVTLATEIANATVHAITRANSECAVFRFIATSEWKAGDTATVDGVPVTALLPSGETLPDGAYVINANVLCILTGTNLTIYVERKKAENANEIAYNDTTVGAELLRLDEEVGTVNDSLGWKLLGTLTKTNNSISLPSKFKELYVYVGIYKSIATQVVIPRTVLRSETRYFTSGFYASAQSTAASSAACSLDNVYYGWAYRDGNEVEATMEVYYR